MSNLTEYQHLDYRGNAIDLPVGKAVCVGRNYLDHIKELNNTVPTQSIFFIKPSTAIVSAVEPLNIPQNRGSCHNELELCILIKSKLTNASADEVMASVWGVGLALDLTLRDKQDTLKEMQHPWERAKSFDGACPTAGFVPLDSLTTPLDDLSFSLTVNGVLRQSGHSKLMITGVLDLISSMSSNFTLMPGDMVLTGTPKGVGPLVAGDRLNLVFEPYYSLETYVN